MKTKLLISTAVCALALVSACVPNQGQTNTYSMKDIGETLQVKTGKITYIEKITIKPDDRDYGTYLGAAGGALAGSTLGKGSGQTLFALGGLLGGALAGNQIDKATNSERGLKIGVKLDNKGGDIAVKQIEDPNRPLYVGQSVRVEMGNSGSRVIAQ